MAKKAAMSDKNAGHGEKSWRCQVRMPDMAEKSSDAGQECRAWRQKLAMPDKNAGHGKKTGDVRQECRTWRQKLAMPGKNAGHGRAPATLIKTVTK
ncbi:hypothetical protein [Bacillus sp. FJAT-42376]|uniref:hypothetical protein n=1 Tax=Bacillus sp. FJAT-42376 TaxID=2014076 RepID=UPI000F50CEE7|nr:hypothetical protein [Bacillus sp. FJAT-42376]